MIAPAQNMIGVTARAAAHSFPGGLNLELKPNDYRNREIARRTTDRKGSEGSGFRRCDAVLPSRMQCSERARVRQQYQEVGVRGRLDDAPYFHTRAALAKARGIAQ